MPAFKSPAECREVIGRAFELMSRDPDMGPRLRYAETPQRFELPDLGLVVNVAAARDLDSPDNLVWEWSDDVDWEPAVVMTMDSDVANRWFQGKENIATAITRGRISTTGDVQKALDLLPITKPVFKLYSEMVAKDYPHLVA